MNVDYLQVAVDEVIPFDASGSTDDGTIVEYRWDFGNGFHGSGTFVDFPYSDDGVFQGTMIVTDDDGNTHTATSTIVVGDPNHGPQILSTPNDGTDQFEHRPSVVSSSAGSGRAYGMTAGDFDHDGNMDFLVSRDGVNVIAGLGDGKGGFATREFNTSLGHGRRMDVADFDHDGNLDFVRGRVSSGQIHLWRGDGLGGFTNAGQLGDSGVDPYGVTATDFNNDGHADFIADYGSNGDTYFWPGNGDGSFGASTYVGSADLNNCGKYDNYDLNRDGNQDLITVSYSSRVVRYYPGNGDGTFGAAVQVNPSNTPANILGVAVPPGAPPRGDPIARLQAAGIEHIQLSPNAMWRSAGMYGQAPHASNPPVARN